MTDIDDEKLSEQQEAADEQYRAYMEEKRRWKEFTEQLQEEREERSW